MAVQMEQTEFNFLKPDYYPKCFPTSMRYLISQGGDVLSGRELQDLVGNWHLNESVSLIAEALHGYPHEQRAFFECVLRGIAQDLNYFPALRGCMGDFFHGIRPVFAVSVRGNRLTNPQILGCDLLDRQYAEAAAGWKKRGDIVCFLTYPSLVHLPRVLGAYRDSERPILLTLSMAGQPDRCYHIIPANWSSKTSLSVIPLSEVEYIDRGEQLMEAGASFAPAPE